MDNYKQHWEKVFRGKAANEVSWFQEYPKTSMQILEGFKLPLSAHIIDIGGGDSNLPDTLIEKGYQNVWVLDISAAAIERSKKRLGEKASAVHWVVSDILDFVPPVIFDAWHDRATFHFLTNGNSTDKYVAIAEKGINTNGYLVTSTFSDAGPVKCSGLPIKQYSERTLSEKFQNSFRKIKCITEDHKTPFNTTQNFLYCSFQKK